MLGKWIECLFEKHKAVRRLALLWACWLITVVVLRVTDPAVLKDVTAPVAAVVGSVVGILTVVIGLYQWSRGKDDERGNNT